ncbi:HIT family protein [Antarctobacter jejuensis]|uniref:HIT family protein n=1 Tax=Antarctobacter jejuensis TaxID=1439938 RepID=UPI003FD066B4
MSYDDQNIFAKILRGEIPATKIYEDDDTFCFMDIFPRADGHSLIIPKTPCRNLLDASADQLSSVVATTQKVAQAAMRALQADGVTVQQFNEGPGGQEVFHLHFHVLPRWEGVSLRRPGQPGDMAQISEIADKLRTALN